MNKSITVLPVEDFPDFCHVTISCSACSATGQYTTLVLSAVRLVKSWNRNILREGLVRGKSAVKILRWSHGRVEVTCHALCFSHVTAFHISQV